MFDSAHWEKLASFGVGDQVLVPSRKGQGNEPVRILGKSWGSLWIVKYRDGTEAQVSYSNITAPDMDE